MEEANCAKWKSQSIHWKYPEDAIARNCTRVPLRDILKPRNGQLEPFFSKTRKMSGGVIKGEEIRTL